MISLGINILVFGLNPLIIAHPSKEILWALMIAAVLLVLNHSWLMTATELTRLKYNIYASPEEWTQNDARKEDVAAQGWIELERHHNAHRNTTENTVYFIFLALTISVISPSTLAAQIWIIGYAIARIGYMISALHGRSDLRGIFMSVSLLSVYGLTSYLALSFFV